MSSYLDLKSPYNSRPIIIGGLLYYNTKNWKWLGTRRSCLVVADSADTTAVPGNSGNYGHMTVVYDAHDRFFYLPTKDLAPFSIHIPTKKNLFYTDK